MASKDRTTGTPDTPDTPDTGAPRTTVGTVLALWRFPVKSMLGEKLDFVEVTRRGILGDRAYALIDTATGQAVSAKNVKQFPQMLECRVRFIGEPSWQTDIRTETPPVEIALPNGTFVRSDDPEADAVLSRFFGRDVHLAAASPEQSAGSSLLVESGLSPQPVQGAFVDCAPISLLTTSTLRHLNQLQPKSRFDERRFRMNAIVDAMSSGFVENQWVGRTLETSGGVRLQVVLADPRCVMTTLAQQDLPRDSDILRTLAQYNRMTVAGGKYPCAGVYAIVESSGILRTGDTVRLL